MGTQCWLIPPAEDIDDVLSMLLPKRGNRVERGARATHPRTSPRTAAESSTLVTTLAEPDEVRRSARFGSARLFSRWYTDLREGRHMVVVVVSELDHSRRHWIITAYAATRLAGGDIEWKRS